MYKLNAWIFIVLGLAWVPFITEVLGEVAVWLTALGFLVIGITKLTMK